MSKHKKHPRHNNRLEDLFTETELVPPDPAKGTPPLEDVDVEKYPRPDSRQQEREGGVQYEREEPARTKPRRQAAAISARGAGWEDFLDAIRRSTRIGFSSDPEGDIAPLTGLLSPVVDTVISPSGGGEGSVTPHLMATPLLVGDMPVGTLHLESGPDHPWSPQDTELVISVARQTAQHVENLRLLEQAERYRGEAETAIRRLEHEDLDDYLDPRTGDVSGEDDESIGFTFDLEDLTFLTAPLSSVADTAISPPGGDKGGIASPLLAVPLLDGDTPVGALHLESGPGHLWSPQDVELVTSVARQIAQHVENLRLLEQAERYRGDAEAAVRSVTRTGWQDYLDSTPLPTGYIYDQEWVKPLEAGVSAAGELPSTAIAQAIKVREETIGQLVVEDVPGVRVADMVSAVTERLSLHIEALRLLEETENSRQQLDKRAAELETVAQVSTAATNILDPQALLQSVVDLTRYSFDLYHSSVYLLNETGDLLNLSAASGKIGHAMLEEGHVIRIYKDQSSVAKAARTREVVIVRDSGNESEFMGHHLLPDMKSEMSIPLIVGEQLIGVFDVEAETTNRFTEEDTRTFMTLASQTAVALRNAQLYAEQMETVERLRELDHLKSSFLANMSHELRTPLNSILGFTQVILEGLDGPLTEDMNMDLDLIEKNGHHLLNLINEVLDMSKIEAGRVSLSKEAINLPEMLDDVIRTSGPLASEGVAIVNASQLPERMFIMSDAVRIRQMLLNIIGNALKFTEQGSVTIEAEEINEKVQIRVVDTGIGVPPDLLESIFEAFSQVDTSTTRKAGGTGLGLPISRRLAEMHGGALWAESQGISGEGSIFYLELPIGDPDVLTMQ